LQPAHAAPYRSHLRSALAALLALVFVLSASLMSSVSAAALPAVQVPTPETVDAADGSSSACTSRPPFKAVIVVGPVGGETSRFKAWADEIATAAKAAGMAVCKVYTPYADDDTVKAAAKGADLFVALMHGNGSPRPDRTADDGTANPKDTEPSTRNGLGLNAARGSSATKYYGADWVRTFLHLAPDAIVVLSHMCYTSGNSEDYDPLPSYALAVEHVDNFAAGFLDSVSYPSGGHPSAVMAIQSQHFDTKDPRGDLIATLMRKDVTLDRAFMTTYTRNSGKAWEGTYLPNFGAIGTTDFYVTQRPDGSDLRSRGRIHIDPDLVVEGKTPSLAALKADWDPHAPDIAWLDRFAGARKGIAKGSGKARFGYVRAITGDLSFTTAQWRASAGAGGSAPDPQPPSDPKPGSTKPATVAIPRIRGLTRAQAKAKLIEAGLKVSTSDMSAKSVVVRKGRALNTYPSYLLPDGGPRKVKRGTTVRIRLSSGPGPTTTTPAPAKVTTAVAIPRIRGLTPAQARARLIAAGLKVSTSYRRVTSSVVAKGRAVNTAPSWQLNGTARTVKRGTTVHIKVSTGP
jgi:hypothetical protein